MGLNFGPTVFGRGGGQTLLSVTLWVLIASKIETAGKRLLPTFQLLNPLSLMA